MEKTKNYDTTKVIEKIAKEIVKNPKNLENYNKLELELILKELKNKQQNQKTNISSNAVKDANLLCIVGVSSIWAGLGTLITLFDYPQNLKNPNLATLTSIFLLALETEVNGKFIPAPLLNSKIKQAQAVLEKYTNYNEQANNLYRKKRIIIPEKVISQEKTA